MKQDHGLMPYLSILTAIALFSIMDATMKHASIAVGVYSATFLRSLVGVGLVLPSWLWKGARWPDRPTLFLHLRRGTVGIGTALTFFFALVRLPLAEAIALSFISPLIALFLASVLLGEKIERKAIWASLMGLAGVIVIAYGRSDNATAHPEATLGVFAVLLSATLYAWYLILQRQQAQVAKPLEVAVFQSSIASVLLAVAAPWLLVLPDSAAMASIGASAVLAMTALMFASWAYGRAETQALVPFEYTAFLWAAFLGWLVFDEQVTVTTVLGTALIVAGCWIATPRKHIEQTAV